MRPVLVGVPHREQLRPAGLRAAAMVMLSSAAADFAPLAFIALGLLSLLALIAAVEWVLRHRDPEDDDVGLRRSTPRRLDDDYPPHTTSLTPVPEAPRAETGEHPLMVYLQHGGAVGADATTQWQKSDHGLGVLYQGPWAHPADGFQEHTRRAARALAMTGVPVHLRALAPVISTTAVGSEEEAVEKRMEDLLHASVAKYAVTVQQVVANVGTLDRITSPSRLAAQVYTEEQLAAMNAYRVLYTVYERTPIPPGDARAFNRVGQAWVACERDAKALRDAGVPAAKVKVIPVCYMPDDPLLALRSRKRDPGVPRFYHIGKWEPRKAANRIIGAFLREFKPGAAELMLKTSLPRTPYDGYPASPAEAVAGWLHDTTVMDNGWTSENVDTWVHIETRRMPLEELNKIHAWGDVYVSLSRGEGFDMPSLDAKLAGNLLVYTPSGGPQDFASDVDVRVEPTGTVPCHAVYNWEATAQYLDYDIVTATNALSLAAMMVSGAEDSIVPPPWCGRIEETALVEFSAERVGQKMRAALQELVGPEGKLVEP